jgi:hypothetical protein
MQFRVIWDLNSPGQAYHINQMKTLTIIILSGTYCTCFNVTLQRNKVILRLVKIRKMLLKDNIFDEKKNICSCNFFLSWLRNANPN